MANIISLSELRGLFEVSAFSTALGWFGLVANNGHLIGVQIGHLDRDDVLEASRKRFASLDAELRVTDWNSSLRARVECFALGERMDFQDVVIAYPTTLPPFRQRVLHATRSVPFGQTVTYLELAGLAGSPRAARAVGSAMSSNRFPLIVPCHRVVGSCGQLGGFTAPGGLDLKRQMLELESSGKQSP